jgi:hypothetical protein
MSLDVFLSISHPSSTMPPTKSGMHGFRGAYGRQRKASWSLDPWLWTQSGQDERGGRVATRPTVRGLAVVGSSTHAEGRKNCRAPRGVRGFEHEPERVAAARGVCATGARGTTPPGVLHGARRTAARPQATLSKRNHPGGQNPTALAAHLPPPPVFNTLGSACVHIFVLTSFWFLPLHAPPSLRARSPAHARKINHTD